MNRRPVVIGNWKMELSYKGSIEAASAIKKLLTTESKDVDVVVCPSFPVIADIKNVLQQSEKVQVGAQHVHWEEKGAWTGQVSAVQLASLVQWCIVGHSEVRELTGQTDEHVQLAAQLLLKHGITPIICIGETLEERQADQTMTKITAQVHGIVSKATRLALTTMVIVYEPIWAISAAGTGQTPAPEDVAGIIVLIRKLVAERFGNEGAQRLRILYGGSVNPANIQPIVSEPGVDGVLVGGASLHPMDFVEIVRIVQEAAQL